MGILKRILNQFVIHPFKKYKGIKPAQTAAATIISNSKSLIKNVLELKRSETQLRTQIQDYKNKLNEFRGIKGPEPGTEKHGEAKKYEEEYQNIKRYLISLIALISNTLNAFSKNFDKTAETLKEITLDSQIILFELEENMNKFLDYYFKRYRRFGRQRGADLLKSLADEINKIKADLKSELRVLWEASKAQKKRIPSQYTIKELSFIGNVPLLRKIKTNAIESGTLILRIANVKPKSMVSIDESSEKLIKDTVLIQKDVKIIFNRLYHLLDRIKNDIAVFDEVNKRRFLRILNRSQIKYDNIMDDITAQSLRLHIDIGIKPVPIKVEKFARKIRGAA